MSELMDLLYRFEARFTTLIPIGAVPDGLRVDAHFEGRVVEGLFAGATVSGVDYLRFRPDGVGIVDVREVFMLNGNSIEVLATGYLRPAAGFRLPPLSLLRTGQFEWPNADLPVYGYTTFSTAVREWEHLNTAVGLFNGFANPGARSIIVEAERLIPRSIRTSQQAMSAATA